MPELRSVYLTFPDLDSAASVAKRLVDGRLAACVNLLPRALSFYRWEGKLCQEAEVRLVIKTLPACEAALQGLFAELHPYEVPQFLAVPMRASPAYFDWVLGEVEPA